MKVILKNIEQSCNPNIDLFFYIDLITYYFYIKYYYKIIEIIVQDLVKVKNQDLI